MYEIELFKKNKRGSDKWVKLIGWGNKEEAIEIIHDSIKSFKS